MKHNNITLFVMPGCGVCPQMERLFQRMQKAGSINDLTIMDVEEQPELAQEYNIRSVPFYLINRVGFTGLRTQQQIEQLLKQGDMAQWQTAIIGELSAGQLEPVEEMIRQQASAREAMMFLLADTETPLVVRIGLTSIIEGMADGDELKKYENQFIALVGHADERIAVDALYYLSLLGSSACLNALVDASNSGSSNLRTHAAELLDEIASDE